MYHIYHVRYEGDRSPELRHSAQPPFHASIYYSFRAVSFTHIPLCFVSCSQKNLADYRKKMEANLKVQRAQRMLDTPGEPRKVRHLAHCYAMRLTMCGFAESSSNPRFRPFMVQGTAQYCTIILGDCRKIDANHLCVVQRTTSVLHVLHDSSGN